MYKIAITIIMMVACACGRINDREAIHEEDTHQQTDHVIHSTLFTDQAEFFIEYEPLEALKESVFLVHVTDLDTYKPFSSGTVTIEMEGISVTSGQPARPGIFTVSMIPPRQGEFGITFTLKTGTQTESVTAHLDVFTAHDEIPPEEESEMDHAHEDVNEGEIIFLKEQAWRSEFMVEETALTPFSSSISASGEIIALPGLKKMVAASSSGMVIFADNYLVQGSKVTKGQLLFTLSSKAMVVNNVALQVKESLNKLKKSRSEYERHEMLFQKNVVSERQLIASRSRYISDSLHFYSLSANATQEGVNVMAPITGYIHELNVSEGQYAETGQILVTIYSDKHLLIRADLPQQYFLQLKDIATANFRPAYAERTYQIEEFNGTLIASGSSVAENNQYLPLYFEVENDGRLLEGAFTQLFLKTAERDSCLTVPWNALLEEQGSYYLFVQVTGESYTKRPVELGEDDGIRVEVIDGLVPGERIVTKGVMLIKAASSVTGVAGHGHAH